MTAMTKVITAPSPPPTTQRVARNELPSRLPEIHRAIQHSVANTSDARSHLSHRSCKEFTDGNSDLKLYARLGLRHLVRRTFYPTSVYFNHVQPARRQANGPEARARAI